MNSDDISSLVQREIAKFSYDPTSLGYTIGIAWSAENVEGYVRRLKAALVTSYRQQFELRETYYQIESATQSAAEFWVVAKGGSYLEWFDPSTGELGLGIQTSDSKLPVSV